jgi:hypothetical protein
VAKKIGATFLWVVERHASPSSKNQELEDYAESERQLYTLYAGIPLKDALKDLTKRQARIIWFFNGANPNQIPEQEQNDYYTAKRYLGFLLSDRLLTRWSEGDLCPEESFREEYIEYFQGLTVEEFVRFKAYLRWLDRTKHRRITHPARQDEDYLVSLGFLDRLILKCRRNCCGDNEQFWRQIAEGQKYVDRTRDLSVIKTAKSNTLRRLFRDSEIAVVDAFVDRFYGLIRQLPATPVPEGLIEDIVHSIYEKPHLTNMFELFLKFFLASKLSPQAYLAIRTRVGKEPLAILN